MKPQYNHVCRDADLTPLEAVAARAGVDLSEVEKAVARGELALVVTATGGRFARVATAGPWIARRQKGTTR